MMPKGKPHHASLSSPQFPPGTAKVLSEGNSSVVACLLLLLF